MVLQIQLEENFANIKAGSVTADILSGATTAVGTGEVGTTELTDSAVTSVKQAFVGLGSPPTGGYMIQGGAGILASGSLWITYPKAFTATPRVMPFPSSIETVWVSPQDAANIHTASVLILGSAATGSFNWTAIGSGAF